MSIVERFKQYPLVLWAMALYLCSLGFNLKYDFPLAFFAIVSMFTISKTDHHIVLLQVLQRYWTVMLFLIITAIVTLASRDIKHSLLVQVQLVPCLLIYLCLALSVKTEKQQMFVVIALVLAAFIAELSFMAQVLYLSEIPNRLEKMWAIKSPLFVAPNDVLFFAVLAPLAAYLLVSHTDRLVKALGLAYLFLTFVVTFYMQSRQAVGVYLGALCVMAILWRPMIGGIIIVVGVMIVLLVDSVTGKGLINKLVYLFPRRYVWEAAWQMFLDRPWLGHGPGMFKELYIEYLEKAGYAFADIEDKRPMNWAHSLYLEQLAERGIAGFCALALIIVAPLGFLMRSLAGGVLDTYQKSLLACWGAYLVSGIAESSLLRLWVVTTLFLLLGLTISSKKE